MIKVSSTHPPGLVGVPTGGTPRFYEFTDCLEVTEVPEGSHLSRVQSCNVVNNCNALLEQMQPECQWLWLVGDDHTWDPKLLMRLLDRNVDLVVPMVARRYPPWSPVVMAKYVPSRDGKPHDRTRSYSWQEMHEARAYDGGLLPVAAAGSAGMLVRRHVWEAILEAHGYPWFRTGTTGPDSMAEDLDFTMKAANMGFGCYVDCSEYMGHLVTAHINPVPADHAIKLTAHIYGRDVPLYETNKIVERPLDVQPRPRLEVVR